MDHIDRIVHLLKQSWEGTATAESGRELEELFSRYPFLREIREQLHDEDLLRAALVRYESLLSEEARANEATMLQRIKATTHPPRQSKPRRTVWLRYAAAASLVLAISIGLWQYSMDNTDESLLHTASQVLPGGNKAKLFLPDGRELILSDGHDGIIAGEALLYSDSTVLLDEALDDTAVLTLSTPNGGQYQLTLADGTRVWLNAASKLHYPIAFRSGTREVRMEGEAYFEVAPSAEKPFIVHTPSERVEVLGTHFNINAYANESFSAVALVEGRVNVHVPGHSAVPLAPGEQSMVHGGQLSVQNIDTDEAVAWKNGEFMFNNESLTQVMRKLGRWYDLEVEVAPELQQVYIWGALSRYENFAEALRIIKMTDDNIQFKIEGRRVALMK